MFVGEMERLRTSALRLFSAVGAVYVRRVEAVLLCYWADEFTDTDAIGSYHDKYHDKYDTAAKAGCVKRPNRGKWIECSMCQEVKARCRGMDHECYDLKDHWFPPGRGENIPSCYVEELSEHIRDLHGS